MSLQTSIFMHFFHDIASSNKASFHVNLWDRGPITETFYSFAEIVVVEDVDIFVIDSVKFETLDNIIGKSALRLVSGSFHEKGHIVVIYIILNLYVNVTGSGLLRLRRKIIMCIKIALICIRKQSNLTLENQSFSLGI